MFAPVEPFPPKPVLGVSVPGWPIIGLFVAISAGLTSAALAALGNWGWTVGVLTGLLTLWCFWFFRDPERRTPQESGLVVSPADGVVCMVSEVSPPPDLRMPADRYVRISVFMNVFNVHVNRSPVDGTVERLAYHPGKFFNASLDKASEHNERLGMAIRTPDGRSIACVQIAGLIARRIVCQVRDHTAMLRGQRYGLIRFGSRVDVYLPSGIEPTVRVGQKVVAGETVLARDGQGTLVGGSAFSHPELSAGANPSEGA